MSRYDDISAELHKIQLRRLWVAVAGGSMGSLGALLLLDDARLLMGIVAFVISAIMSIYLVPRLSGAFRQSEVRAKAICEEIDRLRQSVEAVYERYSKRSKGERFKSAYQLKGRTVSQFEQAIAVGMYRERREVFVTAFIRDNVVVRVTASIGSPYKCSPADNPVQWANYVELLRCDELRQYHNHPDHRGHTSPSSQDIDAVRAFRVLLGPYAEQFHSYIVCWNQIAEWRVFEYDERGQCWPISAFDAANEGQSQSLT